MTQRSSARWASWPVGAGTMKTVCDIDCVVSARFMYRNCCCLVPGDSMSPKLHRVQVPLMSGKECEKRFRTAGYKVEIDKTIVCAGWPEGGKDACQVFF